MQSSEGVAQEGCASVSSALCDTCVESGEDEVVFDVDNDPLLMMRSVPFFSHNIDVVQHLGGELGATVWDCALVLLGYLQNVQRFPLGHFAGKKVLELGCGVGVCGMAIGMRCAQSTIHLTDKGALMPLIRHNVRLNGLEQRCSAMPFQWSDNVSDSLPCPYDVIIASDCVAQCYADDFAGLLSTFDAALAPDGVILLVVELRTRKDLSFFDALKRAGFAFEKVSDEQLDPVYRADDIGVFEVKRFAQWEQDVRQEAVADAHAAQVELEGQLRAKQEFEESIVSGKQ